MKSFPLLIAAGLERAMEIGMSKITTSTFHPTLFPVVHSKHHYSGSSLHGAMAFEKGGGEKGGGEKGGGEKGGGEKGGGEKGGGEK